MYGHRAYNFLSEFLSDDRLRCKVIYKFFVRNFLATFCATNNQFNQPTSYGQSRILGILSLLDTNGSYYYRLGLPFH